jgi:hypothetical protein
MSIIEKKHILRLNLLPILIYVFFSIQYCGSIPEMTPLRVRPGWQGGISFNSAVLPYPIPFITSILNANIGYAPKDWNTLFTIGYKAPLKLEPRIYSSFINSNTYALGIGGGASFAIIETNNFYVFLLNGFKLHNGHTIALGAKFERLFRDLSSSDFFSNSIYLVWIQYELPLKDEIKNETGNRFIFTISFAQGTNLTTSNISTDESGGSWFIPSSTAPPEFSLDYIIAISAGFYFM